MTEFIDYTTEYSERMFKSLYDVTPKPTGTIELE